MVWFAFALMTVVAILCVVWPVLRQPSAAAGAPSPDVAFYKRQLADLDDDVSRGMLSPDDVAGTRAELGRRLLSAADQPDRDATRGGRGRYAAALLTAVLVPAVALGLYLKIGSPRYEDVPLASRSAPQDDLAALVERVESHLASHPDDYRGYELVAPVLIRMGRYGDAAHAYREMIRLKGPVADVEASYGQALVMAADGVVTAEAKDAFDTALKADAALPQARFFIGVAAEQEGDKPKARAIWQKLADESPAGAPWLDMLHRRIAGLDGQAPASDTPTPQATAGVPAAGAMPGAPSGPMAASIASLPPDQQQSAIRGMVDGLAARLAQNGHDPDGWLRLVRAYSVLGDAQKARQALADARHALADDRATLGRLDGLAHELGLEG